MDEKLLILLGLGAIGYLTATNFNDDENDEEINDYHQHQHQHHNDLHLQQREYGNVYQPPHYEESYLPVSGMSNTSPSISYTNYPTIPENTNVSPLNFGQMVDIKEDYIPSDYVQLNEYGDNPDQIPVYVESTGNVGLPVSDMTDMGADNKYIYDRTLGSIGFTSTKIGGRQRGQADYIRGDLPILPDQGAWFQVSADVVNTLVDGALGNQQALGSEAPKENYRRENYKAGKMMAMRTVVNEETGQVLGECDDEKADYVECIYDTFKKSGRQPTMNELKRMYALQKETQNSLYSGFSKSVPSTPVVSMSMDNSELESLRAENARLKQQCNM